MYSGQFAQRAIILDFNDEYSEFGIKALDPAHIPVFMVHPKAEIRRIRPFYKNNAGKWVKMTTDDKLKCLSQVLDVYKGGCLVIDDINKYVDDHMPSDLTGTLLSNAHSDLDLILHYQSIGRILPKVWQNTNIVRFHCQMDPIKNSKGKITEMLQLFSIAEILVNTQYYPPVSNIRFFVYVNRDSGTIIGNFTYQMFDAALEEYISMNHTELKPWLVRKDGNGKAVYTYPQAVAEFKKKLFQKYWGNNQTQSNNEREAMTIVCTGKKRVGKTHETMRYLREEYCVAIA